MAIRFRLYAHSRQVLQELHLFAACDDFGGGTLQLADRLLWTGWGIGLGVVLGVVAGSMTGWIRTAGLAANDLSARQIALLIGSGTALLSPLVLLRLPLSRTGTSEARVFPRSPFVKRFLLAFAIWNVGVGAFNPFFTAYFTRQLHMSVPRVGSVFSATQFVELGALLAAPYVLRRFGIVPGISMMQAGVAVSLAMLATGPPALVAGITYALFGSIQFMSEPATFTLLMSRVQPDQRAGASSLSFLSRRHRRPAHRRWREYPSCALATARCWSSPRLRPGWLLGYSTVCWGTKLALWTTRQPGRAEQGTMGMWYFSMTPPCMNNAYVYLSAGEGFEMGLLYDSRDSVRRLLSRGFEMPIHFAAMGSNGAVVVGTYSLSPDHELGCEINIQTSKADGLGAPVNIMFVDRKGEAALVVLRPSQEEPMWMGSVS